MDQGTRTPYCPCRSSINSHWKSDLPYRWIRKSVRVLNFDFKINLYHLGKRRDGRSRKIKSRKNCSIWNSMGTSGIQRFLQSIEITVHFFEKNLKINLSDTVKFRGKTAIFNFEHYFSLRIFGKNILFSNVLYIIYDSIKVTDSVCRIDILFHQ